MSVDLEEDMSSSISFSSLPAELLEQILAFVSEPVSLCRAACTCKTLSDAVSTNLHLWERLYKMRWTYPNTKTPFISQQNNNEESQLFEVQVPRSASPGHPFALLAGGQRVMVTCPLYAPSGQRIRFKMPISLLNRLSPQGYIQRHKRDSLALGRVVEIAKNVQHKRHYGLGRKYNDPMWIQMCDDTDSLDVLRSIVRNKQEEIQTWYKKSATSITPLVQSIAAQLLEHVHFRIVMHNYKAIFSQAEYRREVERACLLISQSLWSWHDLVSDESYARMSCAWKTLHVMTGMLQERLDEMGGIDKVGALNTVRLLRTILVDEMDFRTENAGLPTSVQPLLLDHVLETKIGAPIMLAVIYRCVLRRVGIRVRIVRLANERIVLGLKEDEMCVDVFEDIDSSERLFPTPWNPDHEKSLSSSKVLALILSGIRVRLENTGETFQSLTTRLFFSMARTRVLEYLGKSHSKVTKPFGLHRWLTCFVDPEIFWHFGLISERKMKRHAKAWLRHALLFLSAELVRTIFNRNYHHDVDYILT